jgi:hypothetical protein
MYNSIGFIFNFQLVLREWRREMHVLMHNSIDEKDLVVFTYKSSEYKTNSEELNFDGILYDVVKTKIEGENTIVYCLADEEETRLTNEYNELVIQNTDTKNTLNKRISGIFKRLLNEYIGFDNYELRITNCAFAPPRWSNLNYDVPFVANLFDDIPSPPPRA